MGAVAVELESKKLKTLCRWMAEMLVRDVWVDLWEDVGSVESRCCHVNSRFCRVNN